MSDDETVKPGTLVVLKITVLNNGARAGEGMMFRHGLGIVVGFEQGDLSVVMWSGHDPNQKLMYVHRDALCCLRDEA